jgi:ectoine hydroxylase-related dioxygenase (phytanoyl-CoA dioxygenase family)
MSPSDAEKRSLDEDGYVVLPEFIPDELRAALRKRIHQFFDEEGELAGSEFKYEPGCGRLANLADKGEVFLRALLVPGLRERVAHVLGPALKLSSLNARRVPPSAGAQPLHADMAAVADERGYWVCNTVWLLDDFTPQNGTLRVVPGSHRWGALPQSRLADPSADHPDEVKVSARAGTLVVMNAHLWHGGTVNRTSFPRTAMHAFFARRDRPQQQCQRRMLRPEVQAGLSAELRELLALDDEPLDAEGAGRSGFLV